MEYNIDLNVLKSMSHTPKDAYIMERLGVHYTHIVWRIFFSLDGDGAVFLVLGIYGVFFVWAVLGLCVTRLVE